MTTVSAEVACAPPPAKLDASAPRKRRRRAPATGATDDCFACLEKKSKCDRRRPYCTPCLDRGKDCSGYKTTLTWGVGVASRGKLRGLTLPIIEKAAQSSNPKAHRARSSASSSSGASKSPQSFPGALEIPAQPTTVGRPPISTNYNLGGSGPTEPSQVHPSPPAYPIWHVPTFQAQLGGSSRQKTGLRRRSLRPLNVPLASAYQGFGISKSASFFEGYHYSGYMSPVQYPLTPDNFTFTAGPNYSHKAFPQELNSPVAQHDGVSFQGHGSDTWPCGTMSSSLSSNQSHEFTAEGLNGSDQMDITEPPISLLLPGRVSGIEMVGNVIKKEEDSMSIDSSLEASDDPDSTSYLLQDVSSRFALESSRSLPSLQIGKTPRLQYLIDYYQTTIAPYIVAFDSPTNPYRTHIMRLAVDSETLQHAIAALSASNIRTREYNNADLAKRKSPNSMSYTSIAPFPGSPESESNAEGVNNPQEVGLSSKVPSAEERYYKHTSVQILNAQLTDPLRRKDDCILATLLILCLYHICDTGVAKFSTQFEGVRRILGMRGSGPNCGSTETNWLSTMFTWFDAMTATVNDREGQLQGAHLDMAAFSGDEWGLENLAGCDGQLFRIIAKLGRLNMLSQGRQAERRDLPRSKSMTCGRAASVSRQDYYSLNHNRFDGNGWANLLEDEELMVNPDDSNLRFWKEWSQIRTELQTWELESPALGNVGNHPHIDRDDLLHISQSFRYSALIYTVRLAHPHLPSLHPNFQNLVADSIFHMTSVKSDVFLLWPLFITGTECVNEHHRSIVRQRCLQIQKDSGFFNNISVLELLEKIWRDDKYGQQEGLQSDLDASGAGNSAVGGQKFRWRKAMERTDGEYIVI